MYPSEFFGLYPPYPRTDDVFVGMSFHPAFTRRWESVLLPALSDKGICGRPLNPRRVDLSKSGNSILTEILALISNSLVIVADVSALGSFDDRPVRNANVLYEVGLAHATRLPEEVLLFRSDAHVLDFDVANVRVHPYDPDGDPEGSRAIVTAVVRDSLSELALRRRLAISRAVSAMDAQTFYLLSDAVGEGIANPRLTTVREVLGGAPRLEAIRRLLDLGAVQARFTRITLETLDEQLDVSAEKVVSFHATTLGYELYASCLERMGIFEPEVLSAVQDHMRTSTANTTEHTPAV